MAESRNRRLEEHRMEYEPAREQWPGISAASVPNPRTLYAPWSQTCINLSWRRRQGKEASLSGWWHRQGVGRSGYCVYQHSTKYKRTKAGPLVNAVSPAAVPVAQHVLTHLASTAVSTLRPPSFFTLTDLSGCCPLCFSSLQKQIQNFLDPDPSDLWEG